MTAMELLSLVKGGTFWNPFAGFQGTPDAASVYWSRVFLSPQYSTKIVGIFCNRGDPSYLLLPF